MTATRNLFIFAVLASASAACEEGIRRDGSALIIERNYGEDYPTISPDGKTLAICGNERLRFVDLHAGKEIARFEAAPDTARRAVWAPDGKSVVTIGDKIVFWSADGRRVTELIADVITPGLKPAYFSSFAFSPDGRRMAIGFQRGEISVMDVARQNNPTVLTEGHTEHVRCLAWNKDQIASGGGYGDGAICLWNAQTGELLKRFQPFDRETRAIAFHPDNRVLFALGNHNEVVAIDPVSGDVIRKYPLAPDVEDSGLQPGSLGFLDNGAVVFATQDSFVDLWTFEGERLRSTTSHGGRIRHAEVSGDGKTFVSAGGNTTRVISTRDLLAGLTVRKPSKASRRMRSDTSTSPAEDTFGLGKLDNWTTVRGTWKQQQKRIVGSGDSRLNFQPELPGNMTLNVKLLVHGQTNPRIRLGSFHFGYEGRNQEFFLHGPKAEGKRFPFETDREYAISIRVADDTAELRIDGSLVATSHPKPLTSRTLAIEAGGRQSKGSCEFFDFAVIPEPE